MPWPYSLRSWELILLRHADIWVPEHAQRATTGHDRRVSPSPAYRRTRWIITKPRGVPNTAWSRNLRVYRYFSSLGAPNRAPGAVARPRTRGATFSPVSPIEERSQCMNSGSNSRGHGVGRISRVNTSTERRRRTVIYKTWKYESRGDQHGAMPRRCAKFGALSYSFGKESPPLKLFAKTPRTVRRDAVIRVLRRVLGPHL